MYALIACLKYGRDGILFALDMCYEDDYYGTFGEATDMTYEDGSLIHTGDIVELYKDGSIIGHRIVAHSKNNYGVMGVFSRKFTNGKAYRDWETDRKSTRLNSSHSAKSRMPSSA